MSVKTCTRCLKTLPIEQFTYRPDQGRYVAKCKGCVAEYHKQYYQNHRTGRQDKRYLIENKAQCKECKRLLPATTEYFWAKKSGLAGLSATCKECLNSKRRASYTKKRILVGGKKQCSKCGQWFPADTDHFSRNKMGWLGLQPDCKTCASKRTRQWAQTPTGKLSRQISRNNYYSRLRNAVGSVSPQEIDNLFHEQGGVCFYCHKNLTDQPFQVDHYIPISKGGTNTIDNIRIACRRCNLSKRDKLPSEWSAA